MLDSRINQISERFYRDYDNGVNISYTGNHTVKDTYINDDQLPNLSATLNFQQKIDSKLKNIDEHMERKYEVDSRILNLERNAEDIYLQKKSAQERLLQNQEREKSIRDSLYHVRSEKEKLYDQINDSRYLSNNDPNSPTRDRGFQNDSKIFSKTNPNFSSMGMSVGPQHMSKSVQIVDKVKDTARYPDEHSFHNHQDHHDHHHSFSEIKNKNMTNSQFQKSNQYDLHGSHGNEDFNFNQTTKYTKSPLDSTDHSQFLNTGNMEKMKQHSKHCGACAAKFRFTLNEVNPYYAQEKISDDLVRKVLIQLKTFLIAKKYKEADALALKSLNDGYSHADLYYMSGEIKRALGNEKEAESYFLQALTFEVHSPYVYQSLALTYIDKGEFKRAIPLLKHFVEKNVSDTANYELGKCLAIAKSYLEATVYFSKAIEINPKVAEYFLHRGDSYEALGFMKLAIDDFREYRNQSPKYKDQFERNIQALERQGNHVDANNLKAYLKKISV
jgi:tetratricopeptide (TPR) repeat protein